MTFSGGDMDDEKDRIEGLNALAEVTPPPSLVASVMSRVAEPVRFSLWAWLWRARRIEFRLSPVAIVALLLVGGATSAVLSRARNAARPAPAAVASNDQPPDTVVVRFVLVARGTKTVAVAGDFNQWSTDDHVLENTDGRGTFVATVRLPRGAHEYMFIVDGEWVTDPAAAERRPDGFGRTNA